MLSIIPDMSVISYVKANIANISSTGFAKITTR